MVTHLCSIKRSNSNLTASQDTLFEQLAKINVKHAELKKQLEDAKNEHECQKELAEELKWAKKENQDAEEECDKALESSVFARIECECQIIHLFHRAAEDTLGPDTKKPHDSKSEFHLNGQK